MEHYKNLSLENIVEEINGVVYTEEWKDILDFEGLYQVSTFGRIKSLQRVVSHKITGAKTIPVKILKGAFDAYGYRLVNIWKDNIGYTKKVHRLVGIAFINNPYDKPEVNHKWGIKDDNRITELEWSTPSENQVHSYVVLKRDGVNKGKKGALCIFSKPVICTTLGIEFVSAYEAEHILCVGRNSISMICNGIKTSVKGLSFRFKVV